jgi:hypothetical protein
MTNRTASSPAATPDPATPAATAPAVPATTWWESEEAAKAEKEAEAYAVLAACRATARAREGR